MTVRAFVTGANGQDGSYLAEQLLADGVDVHALSRSGERGEHLPGEVVVHRGDLRDIEATRALLLDLAPSEVYNLAAVSSVSESFHSPDLTAAVNGSGAVGLLESAYQLQERSGRPVRFVQASSAGIFGDARQVPQDEHTPVRPVNPYGAAKAYAHLAVDVWRRRGLHATSLVLYNHESPRRGTGFVTRKITSTVAAIAQGRSEALVLGSLDVRRDWGWAPDYVDAMVRAARAEAPDDYVIATGVGHTVREFVAAAFAHVGIDDWEGLVTTDPALVRPADPADLVGDASRARAALGWKPTVDFHGIVGAMVDADRNLDTPTIEC
jgi:GDPmannose 4,6-dehydratase